MDKTIYRQDEVVSFPYGIINNAIEWLIFNYSHSMGRNGDSPTFIGRGKSLQFFLTMLIFNLLSCAHVELGYFML
jgi:hypothetical protein